MKLKFPTWESCSEDYNIVLTVINIFTNTCTHSNTPLSYSSLDDSVDEAMPLVDKTLLCVDNTVERGTVDSHSLLQHVPDFVVDRTEVWAVVRNGNRCILLRQIFHSVAPSVSRGIVHLERESFSSCGTDGWQRQKVLTKSDVTVIICVINFCTRLDECEFNTSKCRQAETVMDFANVERVRRRRIFLSSGFLLRRVQVPY